MIKDIEKFEIYYITTDEKEYNEYIRYSASSWMVRIGESEEPQYDCEELEAEFQRMMEEKRNEAFYVNGNIILKDAVSTGFTLDNLKSFGLQRLSEGRGITYFARGTFEGIGRGDIEMSVSDFRNIEAKHILIAGSIILK